MDKDEFVEKISKNQENVIHVEFDDDQNEVDIIYDVTDPDTGEYDPLVVIDVANMAYEHKVNGKLISFGFQEDENLRCLRICLRSEVMDDWVV